MDEQTKIKRAIESLPYEILAQWSDQSDDSDLLLRKAAKIAEGEGTSIIKTLLMFAEETLSTYEGDGDNRHINYDLKNYEPETWARERKEIKAYISRLKRYAK